ncbi:hypothetical protein [Sphingobium yanoikuyae]|uniref:hypothetical protein n=1 Tax=Sphingobium yanoikuyae TaxID=13690 RepID=UPI0028A9EC7B|nr:hypothetical protein [Sphingobium yanoikuyae]
MSRRDIVSDRDLLKAVEALDSRFVPLFERGLASGTSLLEQRLGRSAFGDGEYHCLAPYKKLAGMNHHHAENVATGRAKVHHFPLFSNRLAVTEPDTSGKWPEAKGRLRLGTQQIFTFEFDVETEAFLVEQLGWCLPKPPFKASALSLLHDRLRQYADYRLMTVVWSGNKSLHIHVTFETQLYLNTHASPCPSTIQGGHKAHWGVLRQIVLDVLRPSVGAQPDGHLSYATSFRRTPNALRKLDKPNILGFPAGISVRQVVLFEEETKRQSALKLLLSPSLFSVGEKVREPRNYSAGMALPGDQHRHCERRLLEFYDGTGLDFVRLVHVGDGHRALFRNSPDDRTPSTYIGEAFVTPRFLGTDADLAVARDQPPLPAPLGQMIRIWCAELDQTDALTGGQIVAARKLMAANLPRYMMLVREPMILTAPEGISKTTTIINDFHRIDMVVNGDHRPTMFAFADYANAEEKAEYFNQRWVGSKHFAIVWRSWSRWYSDICEEMGCEVLTETAAMAQGISLWRLIERAQPVVRRELEQQHRDLWQKIGERQPVIMTVHDVGHRWGHFGRTRQLFDPNYFDRETGDDDARNHSALSCLIHDEVSVSNLVRILTDDQMAWINDLGQASGDIWAGPRIAQQRRAFDQHVEARGSMGFDFHAAREMMTLSFDEVSLRRTAEYPPFPRGDRYACDGERMFVAPRKWWMEGCDRKLADRIIFLTTETVPTHIAEKAFDGRMLATSPTHLRLGKDPISVGCWKGIRSKYVDEITREYHNIAGWTIIANKLGGDIANGMTHAAARGRNDLASQSIVQMVTMLDQDHYRIVQALNAWTGREDLVLLTHVDQINQTAGRNRGFRRQPGTDHHLLINPTLYRALMSNPAAMSGLRYRFEVTLTKNQKRKAQEQRKAA